MDAAAAPEKLPPLLDFSRVEPWRELAILSLLLMDLGWITQWFQVLVLPAEQHNPLRTFTVLASVFVGFHLASRALKTLRIRMDLRRWILGFIAVAGFYAVLAGTSYAGEELGLTELLIRPIRAFQDVRNLLPAEFLAGLFVLLIGWRALVISQGYIGPGLMIASFRFGFLMFLLYALFIVVRTGVSPWIWWGLFLAAGMMGIGASRVAVLHTLRGGRRSPFNRDWLIGFVLSVLGVLGIAALFAQLIAGFAPTLVILGVQLGLLILGILLIPIVFLVVWLLTAAIDRLNLAELPVAQTVASGLDNLRDLVNGLVAEALDLRIYLERLIEFWLRWGPTIRLVICSSVILLIMAAIVMRIRDISLAMRADQEDDGQIVLDTAVLWDSLKKSLLESWLAVGARLSGRWSRRNRALAAERIRQIYTLLMDLCADLGDPRSPAVTPWEYRKDLERLFPGMRPEIETVTSAYVRIRYGELPEEQDELMQVEQAWDRLRNYGESQVRSERTA